MQIPAMDAVRSERTGVISGDDYTIAVSLHDESVENKNHGEAWKWARPFSIRTTQNIVVENALSAVADDEKREFSQAFWEQAGLLFRWASDNYEIEEGTTFDPQEAETDFEVVFLSGIYNNLMNGGVSEEVWRKILEEAQFNRIEENETGDVDLFGDEGSFNDGKYTNQAYLPTPEEVDAWGLYNYSFETDEVNTTSLWVRIRDGDDVYELPLTYNTRAVNVIVSMNPDFGGGTSNHIDESVQEALENRNSPLLDGISEEDLNGTVTVDYLDQATQSQDVTQEEPVDR